LSSPSYELPGVAAVETFLGQTAWNEKPKKRVQAKKVLLRAKNFFSLKRVFGLAFQGQPG
jgi:hypothetical protein